MCLSLLVFTQLFFESRSVEPAKPARKQNSTRNSHSRSCILGSLKSRRRTTYRYVIILVSPLKFQKIARENAENCRSRQPHLALSFDAPSPGNSANIPINLTLPETRAIGLYIVQWRFQHILFHRDLEL